MTSHKLFPSATLVVPESEASDYERFGLELVTRLVWNEARFCFVQERDKNLGSNSLFRSKDRIATEKRHLKRKWKAHIRFENYKSQAARNLLLTGGP